MHHLGFLFTSDKPTLSSLPEQVLVSVLVETVHLRGKAHSLHLLHCITSIQSFNPDLRDLDCGHSLDDRALQTPSRHSAPGFPSLGILPPRIPQAFQQKPPHQCYGKYRWFWEPNCHKGFLCFRIPPHSWMCSPSSPLPRASPLLSRDGAK